MRYTLTWMTEIEADCPLQAAREAYELLESPSTRPRRFTVSNPKLQEVLGPGQALAVELPKENPRGRLVARVEEDGVICPYCDSDNTHYVEDVGQYAPLSVEDGHPVCWGGDLEVDEEGDDPRVLCFGCGRDSELPPGFYWAEVPPPS